MWVSFATIQEMLQSMGVQFRTERLRASLCVSCPVGLEGQTRAMLCMKTEEIFQCEATIITNADHIREPQIVTFSAAQLQVS